MILIHLHPVTDTKSNKISSLPDHIENNLNKKISSWAFKIPPLIA